MLDDLNWTRQLHHKEEWLLSGKSHDSTFQLERDKTIEFHTFQLLLEPNHSPSLCKAQILAYYFVHIVHIENNMIASAA